jgi:hypothetical protein
MDKQQIKILVYVFAHKETTETIVVYISDCAGGNQSAELWCGKNTGRCFVFHQDAFYDEELRNRRRDNNMISTTVPKERLVHIGDIWGSLPIQEKDYFLVSKSVLSLPNRICPVTGILRTLSIFKKRVTICNYW